MPLSLNYRIPAIHWRTVTSNKSAIPRVAFINSGTNQFEVDPNNCYSLCPMFYSEWGALQNPKPSDCGLVGIIRIWLNRVDRLFRRPIDRMFCRQYHSHWGFDIDPTEIRTALPCECYVVARPAAGGGGWVGTTAAGQQQGYKETTLLLATENPQAQIPP